MKESDLRNLIQEKGLPDSWWLTVDGKVESSPVSLGTAMTLKKAQTRSQIFVAHTADNNPQPNWIELELPRESQAPSSARIAVPPVLSEALAQMDKAKLDRYRSSLNLPDQWWVAVNGEVQKDPVTEEIAKLIKHSNPSAKVLVANVQADSTNPFWIDLLVTDAPPAAAVPVAAPAPVSVSNGPVRTTVRPSEIKVAGADQAEKPASSGKKYLVIAGVALLLAVIGVVAFVGAPGGKDKPAGPGGSAASGVPLVTPEMAYAPGANLLVRIHFDKVRSLNGGASISQALAQRFLSGPLFESGPLASANITDLALSGRTLSQGWAEGPSQYCAALVLVRPVSPEELLQAAKKAGAASDWNKVGSGGTVPLPDAAVAMFAAPGLELGYAAAPVSQVFVGTPAAVQEALARANSRAAAPQTLIPASHPANVALLQAGHLPDQIKGTKAPAFVSSYLGVTPQGAAPFAAVESYALSVNAEGNSLRLSLVTAKPADATALAASVNENCLSNSKALSRRTFLKVPAFLQTENIQAAAAANIVEIVSKISAEDSTILSSLATRSAEVVRSSSPATVKNTTPTKTPGSTPTSPGGNNSGSAKTPSSVTLIKLGATWKYFTGESWPENWTSTTFEDGPWSAGPVPIGYGEIGPANTPVATAISGKPLSLIARHTFQVADPAALKRANLRLQRDDGAVVYLNGREIHRTKMPSGRITPDTLASGQVTNDAELTFESVALPVSLLKAGTNVMAISVHQDRANSTDLFFNVELLGE